MASERTTKEISKQIWDLAHCLDSNNESLFEKLVKSLKEELDKEIIKEQKKIEDMLLKEK